MDLDSPELRYEAADKLVQAHEVTLAAAAYKFFQELGKGLLVVIPKLTETGLAVKEILYSESGGESWQIAAALSAKAGYDDSALYEAVRSYNPRREFVVVVGFTEVTGDQDEHWFVHQPSITPVKAFTLARHHPTEFELVWESDQ